MLAFKNSAKTEIKLIILIKQADYLLYRQLQRLSEDFINNGGFSERMMRLRKKNRGF